MLVGLPQRLLSAQYAVLVGVRRYPPGNGKFDLDGPRYDIAAIRDILIRRYGFANEAEKAWFTAGWYVIQVTENSPFEDLSTLYFELCRRVQFHNYFQATDPAIKR